MLIFDEIYTGFHRTGRRFACDHWEVQPDLICLGKALTSGFPLAACVGRAKIMDAAWPESTGEALHTSTFLGNPLGCRMALESLELLEAEPLERRESRSSARIWRRACVGSRPSRNGGGGFAASASCAASKSSTRTAGPMRRGLVKSSKPCWRAGIIILSGGVGQNVLSFTPPFVISEEEIDFALGQIAEADAF